MAPEALLPLIPSAAWMRVPMQACKKVLRPSEYISSFCCAVLS